MPIPVFYYKASQEPLMTAETIAHIEAVVQEHGSDAWWTFEVRLLSLRLCMHAQSRHATASAIISNSTL